MAIPEWAYYPAVQSYLRRLGYVCESKGSGGKVIPFIMKGSGQIILDVFGIRTPGSPFSSELEVAAVEVKRSTSRASLRYMHQALNSSKIAHKCYLAMPRKYTDKDLKMAAELGIGLLTIRGRNQVRLESESRRFDPNESSLLEFLRRNLAIAKCGICGNFASLFDHLFLFFRCDRRLLRRASARDRYFVEVDVDRVQRDFASPRARVLCGWPGTAFARRAPRGRSSRCRGCTCIGPR